jgi:hypothetical protein
LRLSPHINPLAHFIASLVSTVCYDLGHFYFMAYVYKHIRKDTDEIFYIGIAKTQKRIKSTSSRNKLWHSIVNKVGFYYEIIEDNLSWESAQNKEIELIKLYGRRDLNQGSLVNMTDGGEGCSGFKRVHSAETKVKISNSLIGKSYLTEEGRKRISENSNGKAHTIETKKHLSDINKGKKLSKEHVEKIIKSKTGKKVTGVALENIRKANIGKNKGLIRTEAHKQKISKALKGKPITYKRLPMSDAQKLKISETLKNKHKR